MAPKTEVTKYGGMTREQLEKGLRQLRAMVEREYATAIHETPTSASRVATAGRMLSVVAYLADVADGRAQL